MMIAQLPLFYLILAVVGAIVGSLINWAIYSWTYFLRRPISPWMKQPAEASNVNWLDRMPIAGWITRRRESGLFGRGFWVRPLLIEIAWAIGLPWFYIWQIEGGLVGGIEPVVPPAATWAWWTETWFYGQAILIALLCIATFIDFDERTIPDYITVPGTLVGLGFAAAFPWFRLPLVTNNMAGNVVESLHFGSPQPLPGWHLTQTGLVIGLLIFSGWIVALLPRLFLIQFGFAKAVKLMVAHVVRPKRRTSCAIRIRQRKPSWEHLGLGILWLVGMPLLAMAYFGLSPENWTSLFGALYGLAFGGGMIWAIRIVARFALGKEAMGFGDVTLMAMIGAFLGWQSTLITFAIAPFAALFIAAVAFLFTRDNELAFGPYLCFGCVVMLIGWNGIWPKAVMYFNFIGPWMVPILFGMLVMMAILLFLIEWIKTLFLGPGESQS